jgi:hypothetical protein
MKVAKEFFFLLVTILIKFYKMCMNLFIYLLTVAFQPYVLCTKKKIVVSRCSVFLQVQWIWVSLCNVFVTV